MSETTQEKPVQRLIRLVINLLVIVIVGIAAFLAWDRFRTGGTSVGASAPPVAEE